MRVTGSLWFGECLWRDVIHDSLVCIFFFVSTRLLFRFRITFAYYESHNNRKYSFLLTHKETQRQRSDSGATGFAIIVVWCNTMRAK